LAYETTITRETGERLVVLVEGVPVTVRLNRRRGGGREGGVARSGPLRITAAMPGKVVRILAKIGDAVRARQPVVVVEAMKMENELRTDREGTVTEIHAREGASVEAGALLIVIQ
jgi:biotin carboxyl carrier protein